MTDQQTKSRRIHELMGRCVHEGDVKKFVIPHKDRIQCVGYKDGDIYLHRCECGSTAFSGRWDFPDYYGSIEKAREALAFAVERKGAEVVNGVLARIIKHQWASVVADPATQRGRTYNEFVEVALAPASVLCDAVLAVFCGRMEAGRADALTPADPNQVTKD